MNRRSAIQGAAALLGVPMARAAAASASVDASPLPPVSLLDRDAEKYWLRIRDEQFFLRGKDVVCTPTELRPAKTRTSVTSNRMHWPEATVSKTSSFSLQV